MSEACEMDEHGHCKTHGPGTAGEADMANKVVEASAEVVRVGMAKVYASWKLLDIMSPLFEEYRTKNPGSTLPEIEIHRIFQEVLESGVKAVRAIEALRVLSPNAS